MAARVTQVPGERLSEFLSQPRGALARVEVVSAPPSWLPLKPALVRFAQRYRGNGELPPVFRGVPLCLFGSEWSGVRSTVRTVPARGRCAGCEARDSCGFDAEVPGELHPISAAPLRQRWHDYGAAFARATGTDAAAPSTSILEKIVAAYGGPVSLEPSVLLSDGLVPSYRFVVFPHRSGVGAAAKARYEEVLACAEGVLAELGSKRGADLVDVLGRLPPVPIPLGLDGGSGSWSLKMYLRLEDRSPVERQTVLDEVERLAPAMHPVAPADLQMLGLVVDDAGLSTVKAYVVARPTSSVGDGFPPPLAADHPLVALAGDRALATIDLWCRGSRRANKWDFNLREHYLAGEAAERLVAEIASRQSAADLRPLLVGPTYRADIVAVGLRLDTVAVYMELN